MGKVRIFLKNNTKLIVLFILFVSVLTGAAVTSVLLLVDKEESRNEIDPIRVSLNNCLDSTKSLNQESTMIEYYDAQIQCYKDNNYKESSKKINDLEYLKTTKLLNSCLDNARVTYNISQDEETHALNSGIYGIINLFQKKIDGLSTQVSCYKTYKVAEAELFISDLEIEIKRAKEGLAQVNGGYDYVPPSDTTWHPTAVSPSGLNNNQPSTSSSCEQYYSKYLAQYNLNVSNIVSRYNSLIQDAQNSCSSFGGCPRVSQLNNQREVELQQEKNSFQSNLDSVGCGNYYDL